MKKRICRYISMALMLILMLSLISCRTLNGNYIDKGIKYSIVWNTAYVREIGILAGTEATILGEIEGKTVTEIRYLNGNKLAKKILKKLTLPDTIEYIDLDLYRDYSALEYNEYDNAYYLGTKDNPYFALIRVKQGDVPADSKRYRAGVDINIGVEKETLPLPPYLTERSYVSECKIHPDTKVIAESAFSGCERLKSLYIPDGVRFINGYAFYSCESLESISFGSELETLHLDFGINIPTIEYRGTMEQWMQIGEFAERPELYNGFDIVCTDGVINKSE